MVERFVAILSDGYYADANMIRQSLQQGIPSNLIHLATMVKIDLYSDGSMPFSVEALNRARVEKLPGSTVPIRFASPEDVLLAKLQWYRDGGERSERQWNDILGIIRVQADSLDSTYLDRWLDLMQTRDLYVRANAAL